MKAAFAATLTELARRDSRIVLLTGDFGYMALEPFAEAHPKRFFNVGVAEQNMVGLATGLAEAGLIPFVCSIATFASLRPYEFVRNGPVAHRSPVRIVGIGGGFEYGRAGPTHHALEDVAVMRALPGLRVIAPADHQQTRSAIEATWDLRGPIYYRLGTDDKAVVAGLDGQFRLDEIELIRDGRDALILTMGPVANEAINASKLLATRGIRAAVAVCACLSPSPVSAIASAIVDCPVVATVEAHSIAGGLGSIVAETIAEGGFGCRLIRCAVRELHDRQIGSQEFYHRRHGINATAICDQVWRALAKIRRAILRQAA